MKKMFWFSFILIFSASDASALKKVMIVDSSSKRVQVTNSIVVVPADLIVLSTASGGCPAGYRRLDSWDGRFILGSPTGASGVAIASGTAYTSDRPNLSFTAHTHLVNVPPDTEGNALANATVGREGVRTSSEALASSGFETQVPYIQVIFCIKE